MMFSASRDVNVASLRFSWWESIRHHLGAFCGVVTFSNRSATCLWCLTAYGLIRGSVFLLLLSQVQASLKQPPSLPFSHAQPWAITASARAASYSENISC